MSSVAIAVLNALSPEELARRLSGPREEVAAFVRAAGEAGSAEAQARFGQMLLDGDGVAPDAAQAFAWFERAARAGHLEAANMVGRCYDLGWGVPTDKARAAAWFRQAAGRGLTWAKYNYATLLALGQGVAEDKAAALALFEEAAAEGNAKAHNFVGSFHEDGWVIERDLDEAARRYAISAEGGDFRGQFNHGRMLAMRGETQEALRWMALAWQNGNPRFRAQMIDHLVRQGEPFRSFISSPSLLGEGDHRVSDGGGEISPQLAKSPAPPSATAAMQPAPRFRHAGSMATHSAPLPCPGRI